MGWYVQDSELRHIIDWYSIPEYIEVDIEPEHLFSTFGLETCLNLSKLTLNTEFLESCTVKHSVFILSTLDLTRSSRFGETEFATGCIHGWVSEDDPLCVVVEIDGKEDESENEDGSE